MIELMSAVEFAQYCESGAFCAVRPNEHYFADVVGPFIGIASADDWAKANWSGTVYYIMKLVSSNTVQ